MVDPIAGLLLIAQILDRLGISYCVGGSIASSAHGIQRATFDADILADLHGDQVNPLVAALADRFYADAGMIRDALARHTTFNVIHYATGLKLDFFISRNRPFDQSQLERRVERRFEQAPDQPVYLASAEDTILAKLEWYRLGNEVSDRQWQDIQSVLRTQRERLDIAYLREWAGKLKVCDLLERALQEAGVS